MSLAPILRLPSPPPILCVFRDLCAESSPRRPTEHPARMRVLSGVPDSPARSRRISTENRQGYSEPCAIALSFPAFSSLVTRRSPLTPLDSALTGSCAPKSFRIRSYEKTWGEGGTSRNPIEDFCPERPAGARDLSSFPTRDFPFSRLHCRPSAVDSQLPLTIHSQHGYFAAAFTLAPRAAQPGLDGIGR